MLAHPGFFTYGDCETVSLSDASSNASKKQVGIPFKPGQVANPMGRPKGSRNKLGEAFVQALYEDFQENGVAVIEAVRTDKPDVYLKVIAQVVPKELTLKTDAFDGLTDEQLGIVLAAARSALGIFDGRGEDITDAAGAEPLKILPPVQAPG